MKKKEFQNLPSTETPINAENLNEMQDNIEESCVAVSPTEPTTNEKVWIDDTHKKLYVRNDDGTYTIFYSEEEIYQKHNYSTEEQVMGTWFGKPLYRKTVTGKVTSTGQFAVGLPEIDTFVNSYGTVSYSNGVHQINAYANENYYSLVQYNSINKTITFYGSPSYAESTLVLTVEYTKTTD